MVGATRPAHTSSPASDAEEPVRSSRTGFFDVLAVSWRSAGRIRRLADTAAAYQLTLYRSKTVGMLLALYAVGLAADRTYHRPLVLNFQVVRASPSESAMTSRLPTRTSERPLSR